MPRLAGDGVKGEMRVPSPGCLILSRTRTASPACYAPPPVTPPLHWTDGSGSGTALIVAVGKPVRCEKPDGTDWPANNPARSGCASEIDRWSPVAVR